MKRKCLFLYVLLILVGLNACKENDPIEDDSTPVVHGKYYATNKWIYDQMKLNYLFYKDIPDTTKLDLEQDPEAFFYTLLSTQEMGKRSYYFSYLEKADKTKSASIETGYGFEFALYPLTQTDYIIRVIYVLPNSPAEKSGIKRGDWYSQINSKAITESNYSQLYDGGAISLTQEKLTINSNNKLQRTVTGHRTLQAATTIENNPVYLDTTYTISGNKVGYLIYNSFTTGPNGYEDKTYDNKLKTVFSKFQKEGINKMILDLRFNGGGYLSSCILLSSMIIPGNSLGKLMAEEKYNDKLTKLYSNNKDYFLNSSEISGQNINQQELYVICSQFTASASELLVNALRPYMTVTLVGDTTIGKNVGSFEIDGTEKNFNYILHPITIKIYNSKMESDYADGFAPNVPFNEYKYIDDFAPLGDTNEMVLNKVLQQMGLRSAILRSASTSTTKLQIKNTSLSRKQNRLIIR